MLQPSMGFAQIGSGTTPQSDSDEHYDGETPWVTTSELREETIRETAKSVSAAALREHPALRLYPEGALVIAMYGATIGRLGILGIPATVNQACCVFAEETRLRARFVYYWLRAFREVLVSHSAGGGQPNLSQTGSPQSSNPGSSHSGAGSNRGILGTLKMLCSEDLLPRSNPPSSGYGNTAPP